MKKPQRMVETKGLPELQRLAPGRVTGAGEIPDADSGLERAGLFKLKQHVDNPGQTPM